MSNGPLAPAKRLQGIHTIKAPAKRLQGLPQVPNMFTVFEERIWRTVLLYGEAPGERLDLGLICP